MDTCNETILVWGLLYAHLIRKGLKTFYLFNYLYIIIIYYYYIILFIKLLDYFFSQRLQRCSSKSLNKINEASITLD